METRGGGKPPHAMLERGRARRARAPRLLRALASHIDCHGEHFHDPGEVEKEEEPREDLRARRRRESARARTAMASRARLSERHGGSLHPVAQVEHHIVQRLEHLFEEEIDVDGFGHRAQKQTDRGRDLDEVVQHEDEEDQNTSEVSMQVLAHLRAQTDVTTRGVAGSRAVEARTALRLTALTSAFDGTSWMAGGTSHIGVSAPFGNGKPSQPTGYRNDLPLHPPGARTRIEFFMRGSGL